MRSSTLFALATASLVSSHAIISLTKGANGRQGQGFALDPSTPRDSPSAGEPQQDTSIIRDSEIESGEVGGCGRTALGGPVDVDGEMQKAAAAGLPTVNADGTVSMTIHQINQDGAGPFTCDVDPTGTGQNFQSMEIVQDVPGADIPFVGSLSTATVEDFELIAQMPSGLNCQGAGGACLVRCRNNAIAGPFGSCAAVAQAGAGTATGASTGASTSGSTGTSTTATTSTDTSSTDSSDSDEGGAGGFLGALGGLFGNKKREIEDVTSLEDIEAALSQVEERVLRSRVARLLARRLQKAH